jgi:phosphatidylglycerophosphate synthase
MLSAQKDFINRLLAGLGHGLARLRIHPNVLTLFGLLLGIICCIYLLISKNLLVFGIFIIFAGSFDLLDGALARASEKISKFGSYLDAICDRFFEVFTVISVAYVTNYWLLCSLCILGLYSVSYAKARAAMEVPIKNNEWPDFLERTERDLVFAFGIIFSQIFPMKFWGQDILWWVLLFLVFGLHFTVIQRVLRARRLMENKTPRPPKR